MFFIRRETKSEKKTHSHIETHAITLSYFSFFKQKKKVGQANWMNIENIWDRCKLNVKKKKTIEMKSLKKETFNAKKIRRVQIKICTHQWTCLIEARIRISIIQKQNKKFINSMTRNTLMILYFIEKIQADLKNCKTIAFCRKLPVHHVQKIKIYCWNKKNLQISTDLKIGECIDRLIKINFEKPVDKN